MNTVLKSKENQDVKIIDEDFSQQEILKLKAKVIIDYDFKQQEIQNPSQDNVLLLKRKSVNLQKQKRF